MVKLLQLYDDRSWGLIYTRSCHEKKVQSFLEGNNIPCYLPVLKKVKSKYRTIYQPMFSGYLFAAWNYREKNKIRIFKSVVNIIHSELNCDKNIFMQIELLSKIETLSEEYDIDLRLINKRENQNIKDITADKFVKLTDLKNKKTNKSFSMPLNLITGKFELNAYNLEKCRST